MAKVEVEMTEVVVEMARDGRFGGGFEVKAVADVEVEKGCKIL